MTTENGSGGPTIIERRGGGLTALLGVAILAVVALVAVFLVVGVNRNQPDRQIADAASSVASSASRAADAAETGVGRAADAANPSR